MSPVEVLVVSFGDGEEEALFLGVFAVVDDVEVTSRRWEALVG